VDWLNEILGTIFKEVLSFPIEVRKGLHEQILERLYHVLSAKGWKIVREVDILFTSIIRSRGEVIQKRGKIDLVATRGLQLFALEFDNTNVLKYKSIEKLLQFRGVSVGITVARYPAESKVRVEQVIKEQDNWLCTDLCLIEILPKSITWFIKNGNYTYEEVL